MRLAIFGFPVAHSLSPSMHRAALAHIGRDGDYTVREVDEAGFLRGAGEIRSGDLDGANVTMPYKGIAHAVADVVTTRAQRVGAVNTLWASAGGLHGDNTDIAGVGYAWDNANLPDDDPVVVLGAGGASAAAQVALRGRRLFVLARRPELAETMVRRIESDATVIEWGDPVPSGVLVNATSLGMRGELLPEYLLGSATALLDMAYSDTTTRSVAALRQRGLPVADGLDMLVGQAVGCFQIWTGENVPSSVFRGAAEAELERRAAQRLHND